MTERALARLLLRTQEALEFANSKLIDVGEDAVAVRDGIADQYEDERIDRFLDTN
jgi:hypothetical protein